MHNMMGPSLLSLVRSTQTQASEFRLKKEIELTGNDLSVAAVVAVARYDCLPLIQDTDVYARLSGSVKVVEDRSSPESLRKTDLYGVNTGFGGSADTRTDNSLGLEKALMQTLQSGILLNDSEDGSSQALRDHSAQPMPTAWFKATMATRINQCIRGHSAVSPEVINAILELAHHRIVPQAPLRGSISASGDLMPLAYLAGTLEGNPDVFVTIESDTGHRRLAAHHALAEIGMTPKILGSREGLGLVNGTAASAAVASLAMYDAMNLALLSTCLTGLISEGMAARVEWLHPFIAEVRPHPGQQQATSIMRAFLQGSKLTTRLDVTDENSSAVFARSEGGLAQDRYPLRTAPQWLGPGFEDLTLAYSQIAIELNSTSDNPITDPQTGSIHHNGNFQATSVTLAVEKIRLSLQMIGKMLFSQCTEMLNHQMSGGLPPNLAADDPSVSFCLKGLDINMAAYQSELAFLANPISNHVQSAEMHNQAINSLALLSTRITLQSVEVLGLMVASGVYAACQAIDLRVMHATFLQQTARITTKVCSTFLPNGFELSIVEKSMSKANRALQNTWWDNAVLDAHDRCEKAARSFIYALTEPLSGLSQKPTKSSCLDLTSSEMHQVAQRLQESMLSSYEFHRKTFFQNPTSGNYLGKGSSALYKFVRSNLGVPIHPGLEGHPVAPTAERQSDLESGAKKTLGSQVSTIYKAIRDGRLFEEIVRITGELDI